MLWYGRLAEYIAGNDGVWSATCDEIARCWVDDKEDMRQMELPDVRGVQTPSPDSSFARGTS
jgi:hypothetical protein